MHYYEGEEGYIELLSDILNHGSYIPNDRTGVGRTKLVGVTLRFDLRKGFPLLSYRKVPYKSSLREFWAFLNGKTDIHNHLSKFGVNFWKGNTTRDFLDKRGLQHLPEGHGGKSYAFQYRFFGGEYDNKFNGTGGYDQIEECYKKLQKDPFSSQNVVSIWNPAQLHEMPLPPCFWAHTPIVTLDGDGNKVLNMTVNARSSDNGIGLPANICQFCVYQEALAKSLGMIPGDTIFYLTDAHLYGNVEDLKKDRKDVRSESQVHFAMEALKRPIQKEPVKLKFKKELNSLEDILLLTPDDIEFEGYKPCLDPFESGIPSMAV